MRKAKKRSRMYLNHIFNRKSGSIRLDTSQKNRSEKQIDKYKSKRYYLASSDSD